MENEIVKIQTAGTDARGIVRPVTVEVEITNGIGIHLVGMADSCVGESLLRVVTALQVNGFHIPGKKVVVNIAPASMYKSSTNLDLPIAIGILQASGQIKVDNELLKRCVFSGELGLDGTIRQGIAYQGYAIAMSTFSLVSVRRPYCLCTCKETALEASPITNVLSYGFTKISDLLGVLQGKTAGSMYLVWNSEVWGYVEEGVKIVKAQSEYPL